MAKWEENYVSGRVRLLVESLLKNNVTVCVVCKELMACTLDLHNAMCKGKYPEASQALISKLFMDCAGENCHDFQVFLKNKQSDPPV